MKENNGYLKILYVISGKFLVYSEEKKGSKGLRSERYAC